MKPTRNDSHALVDLVDVLLRDGAMITADVVITVDGVPLLGIRLQAAIAGMATMTDHGLLADWDETLRRRHEEPTDRARTGQPTGTAARTDEPETR